MNAKPPSDKAEKIVVRLPDGMRNRLAEAAKLNNRSVNAEVVIRLEDSLDEDNKRGPLNVDDFMNSLQSFVEALQIVNKRPGAVSSLLELDLNEVRRKWAEEKEEEERAQSKG